MNSASIYIQTVSMEAFMLLMFEHFNCEGSETCSCLSRLLGTEKGWGSRFFLVGKARIKARMLSQWEMRHIENYIKLPWLTILPRSGKLWGVLHGEARRLFIPTVPGSKGAPSSQARVLCYVNAISQISCLLHRQTQALAWELERSRSSTVHLKPSTHSTLTHT